MNKRRLVVITLAGLLALSGCAFGGNTTQQATQQTAQETTQQPVQYDTVIYGTIFVGEDCDKTVEAVVIKDGIIEYAGDKKGAEE